MSPLNIGKQCPDRAEQPTGIPRPLLRQKSIQVDDLDDSPCTQNLGKEKRVGLQTQFRVLRPPEMHLSSPESA